MSEFENQNNTRTHKIVEFIGGQASDRNFLFMKVSKSAHDDPVKLSDPSST